MLPASAAEVIIQKASRRSGEVALGGGGLLGGRSAGSFILGSDREPLPKRVVGNCPIDLNMKIYYHDPHHESPFHPGKIMLKPLNLYQDHGINVS